ncbi:ATP synthase F0 subunit B [Peterkaempfera bronchialis]|uniref:Cell division initiation protein n=1 Tax=Peterkaempfera bronchialis TaxID=2126346 RepID=A0A345T0U2_9ACTN|nr:ATP synthase F0 subunit B [Peterkaempfera bronchialis]AXI79597.1 cell division initiation protein [Peterkaempfera bronchialis]
MDVQNRLDDIVAAVESARSMPMSASCVVNRSELLGLLRELREALPSEISQAQAVMADHEQVVAEARAEAERIIQGAHAERGSLVSGTEVVLRSQAEADRILAEARAEAGELRREADDYVDSKLANFEVVLTKTLGAVGRGRQKLLGHGPDAGGEYGQGVYGEQGGEEGEEFRPQISPSPEVDEYVDVKLATLETVLSKTLEAVGRGRDKLLGKQPIDELAAYLAAADQAQQDKDRAAAVAAGFAAADAEESAAQGGAGGEIGQAWFREEAADGQQGWGGQPQVDQSQVGQQQVGQQQVGQPDWQQQSDPYAAAAAHGDGGQQGGGYDAYGYPQQQWQAHDPYAAQTGGYAQGHDGSGYPPQPGYAPQEAYGGWGAPQQPEAGAGYPPQPPQPPQQGGLDETSFFDTSVIDVARLRELGGGR